MTSRIAASHYLSRRTAMATAGVGMLGAAGLLAGCGAQDAEQAPAGSTAGSASSDTAATLRVASLKGPTSIGLVSFMDEAKHGSSDIENSYTFEICTTADEILPRVIKGELDIALIPANAASVLYNKTEGKVSCLNINTLGVLSVVTGDTAIADFSDLAGRTVYLTGKGTTPEYTMRYLLEQAGIANSVALEFKSEAAEVVSTLAADASAVGVLPQPFVTAALAKNTSLAAPIDLTDVWTKLGAEGSQLVTGVTVARKELIEEHPDAIEEFLRLQADSVEAVNADPEAAAKLVVEAGIVDAEAIAARAIPGCHLVCTTDKDMEDALSGYLQVLFDADPASVGGSLPQADFYFGA